MKKAREIISVRNGDYFKSEREYLKLSLGANINIWLDIVGRGQVTLVLIIPRIGRRHVGLAHKSDRR